MNKIKPVIYKSNLIVEASYKLSIGEQRIIHILTSMIDKDDEEFKSYCFTIKEFAAILGTKNKNIYTEVAKHIDSLRERDLTIIKENSVLKIKWLSSAEYFPKGGYVELCFDPKLKPYLLMLKDRFTKIPLSQALKFRKQYTHRLYELMKQYEALGERRISVKDLKKYLGIEDSQYPRYGTFKQRVITSAETEINDGTDIEISIKEIKKGKSVEELIFVIKSVYDKHDIARECMDDDFLYEDIKKIMDGKVSSIEAKKLYLASGKNKEKVIEVYNYVKNKEVENLVGYMIALLKNGFIKPIKNEAKSKKDFEERKYDYDELEMKLLGWDKLDKK